ncbi:MAG: ImmA/IrrE family metallo-endopeptidase [Ardenticatenaceae bacterium]|nr:ImmA/IrrE family metallo-endopeptidase [Ardenticatenaceae bacterium]
MNYSIVSNNMTDTNPINPMVLQWARTTAGLSIDEVVQKLNRKKITAEIIKAWESGEAAPDYVQLERLAYEVYKRPLAIFFFPQPPAEETPQQAFRTLPDSEIQRLSPRLRLLLRRAQAMQLNLYELYEGVNPANRQIVRDLQFSLDTPVQELAHVVRQYLGLELTEQFKWRSRDEAFKAWRHALENCGVFVFKDAFKEEAVSGFCLHDKRFPLIYVNNSTAVTRQIFTLFHGLAHLLSGTGGIDRLDDRYISSLSGRNKQIEVLCNRFVAAFLVPEADFDRRIGGMLINEATISTLANQYSVSREVILRRLLDKKLVTPQHYEQLVEEWCNNVVDKQSGGGDYYRTQGAYLGERYLELVFRRLYQNKISVEQLADYLGVKASSVPGMEALILPGGAGA